MNTEYTKLIFYGDMRKIICYCKKPVLFKIRILPELLFDFTSASVSSVHRLKYMSLVMRKQTFWFLFWSDTNQAVQLHKMARGLKFWI